ncbi:MAG: hypothetical protein ACRDZZ_08715, partial [Ilumatobacteraceae bacterium]
MRSPILRRRNLLDGTAATRAIAWIVTAALTVVACGGGDDDGQDGDVEVGRAAADLTDVFDAAGVAIVDTPGGRPTGQSTEAAPLELWSWQVGNLEREHRSGGGYLGSEIDGLVGDVGGLPMSFLVAAWVVEAPTEGARLAGSLIGDQTWEDAPSVVFPTAVLALFVADVAALSEQLGWPSGAAEPQGLVQSSRASAGPAGGVCSTLAGWVNDVVGTLFGALTVDLDDDVFGWLGDIWNAAVGLAEDIVVAAISALTTPVVAAITDAVAVVGTLTMLASLMQPWSLLVVPSAGEIAFAVGDGPDVEASFEARADTNVPDVWPDFLVDCAATAGFSLPDLSSAIGSAVAWSPSGFPELGEERDRDATIGDDNGARLRFVSGREQSDKGGEVLGTVSASVTVTSSTPDQLEWLLGHLLTGQIPIEPVAAVVGELFAALTEPVFDALATLVQVHGSGSMSVVRHEIDEDALYDGTWIGLAFGFNATGTGDTRGLVPITVHIEDGELTTSEASYVLHTFNVEEGVTVSGNPGSSYAIVTVGPDRLSLTGDVRQLAVGGDIEEHYVTDVQSDFDLDPNEFSRDSTYSNTVDIAGVSCAAAGAVNTGETSSGRFVAGFWLVHGADDRASDLVQAGLRLSAAILRATDLPDRPGDPGALG